MSLEQTDLRTSFESLGQGPWTIVYESWFENDANGGIYSAFAPTSYRQRALSEPGWDITKSDFRPGFSQSRENGEWVTTYHQGSIDGEVEPLILVREYHGLVPTTLEVVEQFRLYHNLYWDELTSEFMQPHDDGTSSAAVRVHGSSKIEMRTHLIRQYQAARQMDLLLFIDSVRYGSEGQGTPDTQEWHTESLRADLHPGSGAFDNRPFTRYLGTRVLSPPPLERAGIWPFEEPDDHYPDFIIGTDENGSEVRYTCNPDALGTYFGANPEAPHYLTPVHFRREVLQKYYERPEVYSVEDGYLRCASLWGLQLDNSAEGSVVVFLGDLGRDLPKQDRDLWRSFNISPSSPMSTTAIRRSFLAQFAEPTALDLRVRSQYISLSRTWEARYGWDLFRKPVEADSGLLQRLRLPLNDSQAEFEASIRIMAQLFVDAINEAQLESELATKVKGEKGISKLRRWLEQEGYENVATDIQFLRNLQELRSKVTAHRKGSDYQALLEKIFGDLRGPSAVEVLFESALLMLIRLEEWTAAD